MAESVSEVAPAKTGHKVSERIRTMQGGDFGTSLINMLEQQSVIVNTRLKPPEATSEHSNTLSPSKLNKMSPVGRQILLNVDVKGVPVSQKYPDTMTVDEVLKDILSKTPVKSGEKLALFLPSSGIFLKPEFTLRQHLLKDDDKLKVKAKKENKFIVKVFLRTLNEIELVEFYSHTTAWGLIQLLNKKDIEQPEQYGLFTANGIRLESDQRLTSHGVKSSGTILEYRPLSMAVAPINVAPPPSVGTPDDSEEKRRKPRPSVVNALTSTVGMVGSGVKKVGRKTKHLFALVFGGSGSNTSNSSKSNSQEDSEEDSDELETIPFRVDLFAQMIRYLEEKGLETEGLFRESAPLGEVQKLYFSLSKNPDFSSVTDPHVVAGTLKLYLRNQPEALIPNSICNEYLEAAKQGKDSSEILKVIKRLLPKLPDTNRRILGMLLGFLVKLASLEAKNKMNFQAISICFAPTISFDPNAAITDLENNKWMAPLMLTLLTNYQELFPPGWDASPPPPPSSPQPPAVLPPPPPPIDIPPPPPIADSTPVSLPPPIATIPPPIAKVSSTAVSHPPPPVSSHPPVSPRDQAAKAPAGPPQSTVASNAAAQPKQSQHHHHHSLSHPSISSPKTRPSSSATTAATTTATTSTTGAPTDASKVLRAPSSSRLPPVAKDTPSPTAESASQPRSEQPPVPQQSHNTGESSHPTKWHAAQPPTDSSDSAQSSEKVSTSAPSLQHGRQLSPRRRGLRLPTSQTSASSTTSSDDEKQSPTSHEWMQLLQTLHKGTPKESVDAAVKLNKMLTDDPNLRLSLASLSPNELVDILVGTVSTLSKCTPHE
jgi:hypothetical protein